MNNIKFNIEGAQAHANRVDGENTDLWLWAESSIGITKAHLGSIFELQVEGDDMIMFMLTDLTLREMDEEVFHYVFKVNLILRADQRNAFIRPSILPGATITLDARFLSLDAQVNGE